ncbi:MAG TPA: thiolase family protein [bacterium]|nr:thiolase family protein [bacterium]
MEEVYVVGVGMTKFGKWREETIKSLVKKAVTAAVEHAGISVKDIGMAAVGNAFQGIATGQESIRGQVVLRAMGIGDIPVINVENACASSATAFQVAWMQLALGLSDFALALGFEKMYLDDREKSLSLFSAAMDQDVVQAFMKMARAHEASSQQKLEAKEKKEGEGDQKEKVGKKSAFMDLYAMAARMHMEKYGTTQRQFAAISSKNHQNSQYNPYAQYQQPMTIEEVLAAPLVSYPLTRPMCSPVGDGAAAAILATKAGLKKLTGAKPVKVRTVALGSGKDRPLNDPDLGERLSRKAYEAAGLGPEDVDVLEVHDATAFGELRALEGLGFCKIGEGGPFSEAGNTALGGKIPTNPSGGLESKGHPVGATGVGQVCEIVWQLRGETGKRQVEGARIGMCENGGGNIGVEEAAMNIIILERVGG